jgi:hypothetical protein
MGGGWLRIRHWSYPGPFLLNESSARARDFARRSLRIVAHFLSNSLWLQASAGRLISRLYFPTFEEHVSENLKLLGRASPDARARFGWSGLL